MCGMTVKCGTGIGGTCGFTCCRWICIGLPVGFLVLFDGLLVVEAIFKILSSLLVVGAFNGLLVVGALDGLLVVGALDGLLVVGALERLLVVGN